MSRAPERLREWLTRWWPVLLVAAIVIALYTLGGRQYLTLSGLRDHSQQLRAAAAAHPVVGLLLFTAAYIVVTTASVPGATILTLTGGFLFGTWIGGAVTVVAATVGAAVVYLIARHAIGRALRARAENKSGLLARVADEIRRSAFSYLLAVRLMPIVPFWLVNIAAGVADAPVGRYLLATFLGIVPATFIYAGIGAGLGRLFQRGEAPSLSIIFAPYVLWPLLGLSALALAPALYRATLGRKRVP